MPAIYAIRDDGFRFKNLDLSILDIARHAPDDSDPDSILDFSLRNTAMAAWWPPMGAHFLSNEGFEGSPIPDISSGLGATLVLSPKAKRYLGDLLESYGELLPVEAEGEVYYLFNCRTFGQEDLDVSQHEYLGDTPISLKALAFTGDAEKLATFKSKFENCATVFCNEQFKCAVEKFELTGISFDENLVEQFG
ncbi:hypothetical protein ACJJI3_01585 [Microbulbifer sp. ZKSA004]|uniref:hypothetical protein n=1 Tax=Microbulbifer sp. ZKSA004 TaxID=3243389 RepID=UPI00403A495D